LIDMGNPDVSQGLTNTQVGDGDTTPASIGGRSCRVNINPAQDFYFYFNVSDAWAYQGNKPDVYVVVDYYDAGNSTLQLQYDSIGPDFSFYYKNAQIISLTNTNTWKHYTWHVTDAYFGNRQNSGADFRIASGVGNTFYLDVVRVSTQQPVAPIIAAVTPDPDPIYNGSAYSKQLTLTQGSPAPTWSLLQGPSGLSINAVGLVSGWTPGAGVFGNFTIQVQATNSEGSATKSWTVRVLSRCDFDTDGDVDMVDFAAMQRCFSGDAVPFTAGCEAQDLSGDGDVDTADFSMMLPCIKGADQPPGC
jgi:Dockerin type I domain/Putative Ig domain